MERICSSWSKFLPLRLDPILEGLCSSKGTRQAVTTVVPLCKIPRKYDCISIHHQIFPYFLRRIHLQVGVIPLGSISCYQQLLFFFCFFVVFFPVQNKCFTLCVFKLLFWLNFFPHTSHSNGLAPVCTRMCIAM